MKTSDKLSNDLLSACSRGDLDSVLGVVSAVSRKLANEPSSGLRPDIVYNAVEAACRAGHAEVFPALLQLPSHLDDLVERGFSHTLDSVAREGNAQVLRAILELTWDNTERHVADVHAFGDLALRVACNRNQTACVQVLTALDGDRAPSVSWGVQPGFISACRRGSLDTLQYLLFLPAAFGVQEHLTFGVLTAMDSAQAEILSLLLAVAYHSPSVILRCLTEPREVVRGDHDGSGPVTPEWLLQTMAVELQLQGALASAGGVSSSSTGPHVAGRGVWGGAPVDDALLQALPKHMLPCRVFLVVAAWLVRTLLAGGAATQIVCELILNNSIDVFLPKRVQAWIWGWRRAALWWGFAEHWGLGGLTHTGCTLPEQAHSHRGRKLVCLFRVAERTAGSRAAP